MEKTADEILTEICPLGVRIYAFDAREAMEKYAKQQTESLQKENDQLKQENERLKLRLESLELEHYVNRRA